MRFPDPLNGIFAQYSVLTVLDDATVGLVYESMALGAELFGPNIGFTRFELSFLGGPGVR